MVNALDSIGYIASAFTTLSSVPQIYKIWQTKSTDDVSIMYIVILLIGLTLWLIYSVLVKIYPMIVSSTISILLYISMIIMILVFRKRNIRKKDEIDLKSPSPISITT